jgi:YHS domain-containing protein
MRFLVRLLEVALVLWLVRAAWRTVAGWLVDSGGSGRFGGSRPRPSDPVRSPSGMPPRELVKDPQCGTYVSPDVSIRTRFHGQELHFCSHECEQQFLLAQSKQSA